MNFTKLYLLPKKNIHVLKFMSLTISIICFSFSIYIYLIEKNFISSFLIAIVGFIMFKFSSIILNYAYILYNENEIIIRNSFREARIYSWKDILRYNETESLLVLYTMHELISIFNEVEGFNLFEKKIKEKIVN